MPTRATWVFDLDNTLHNVSPHIFPHIHRSMTASVLALPRLLGRLGL